MNRRDFVLTGAAGIAGLAAAGCAHRTARTSADAGVPSYLNDDARAYGTDPRGTAIDWFREAEFGLFMHYGVASLLERGEWVQFHQKILVSEYAKLKERFTADRFDADFITDLALAADMKYVNLTARHHDSFCLFQTAETDFNSVDAPCGRDLVAELAEAADRKGLGLFLYYSYAADWRHPYFYPHEKGWFAARPHYEEPQPEYRYDGPEDFRHYIEFAHAQLRELLTQYGPVAGIWLDPIMGYYGRPELFPIEETYGLIRSLQPQTLIAFKQGANGDEDFVAPERTPRAHPRGGAVGDRAWELNQGKPIEICDTLQEHLPDIGGTWGYNALLDDHHHGPDHVMEMLAHARSVDANLLLNTGPLPDGSIHPADITTLREVGRRRRA